MKRLLSIACLFLFFISLSYAQSDKLYKSRGFNVHGGIIPYHVLSAYSPGFVVGLGYSLNYRYNLVDVSDNLALGLDMSPQLSLEAGGTDDHSGFGAVYMPIHLSLNLGAGATYDSDANFGIVFSAGVTPLYTSIIGDEIEDKFFVAPSVLFGIRRYKEGQNSLKQFSIRYDYFTKEKEFADGTDYRPGVYTIAWTKYIDY